MVCTLGRLTDRKIQSGLRRFQRDGFIEIDRTCLNGGEVKDIGGGEADGMRII